MIKKVNITYLRRLSFNIVFRLDCRAKPSIWQEEVPNRCNASRSNLKESECPLKDPLNFSRNRRLFADDISEVTSSTRTDDTSQTTSSGTIQDDVPTRDNFTHCGSPNSLFGFGSERKSCAERDEAARNALSGKERGFVSGRNRKYIVSPFRVQRGSFDLAKPKAVVGDLGVDGKSLSYIEESLEDRADSSEPAGDARDRDSGSNAAVRWRITVRRQHANSIPEYAVSEVWFELSEKIRECFRAENYIVFLERKNDSFAAVRNIIFPVLSIIPNI